ncbi:hypothetical protein CRG98_033680 [Punica granatum]|uniref:Uncharacterized protein n=1 Tax=Punica granatum TaxID=22663 RepID=A0A2I0IPF9_PUNGR|nr:hypothetical protein CRG98_033680 [Punica granatum]
MLRKDRGSRLKGINSLKSGRDLWGPNRRSNRATYPYSEPLSNRCFLISVVGRDPSESKASMICNGRATDTREKESPLPVYDPKVEGRYNGGELGRGLLGAGRAARHARTGPLGAGTGWLFTGIPCTIQKKWKPTRLV